MKSLTVHSSHGIQLLALALAAVLAGGCSSTAHYQGDTAASSLVKAADEVQAESRALDLTMGALKDMMNQPSPDLKPSLKHYSAALDRLIAAADRTEATGVRMTQRNAEYLQNWDKQLSAIDFDHVREISLARKTEVTSRCQAVNQRYADSQAAVHPMIDYLEDIRRALTLDLTAGGLSSLKPIIANAESNADKVQTALAALANELTDSGTRMSSIVPTTQATQ